MYIRKTVDRWKYQLAAGLALLLLLFSTILVFRVLTTEPELLKPIPEEPTVMIVRQVQAKEENTVEDEIREVFGEYADEAFELLECENKGLDPEAVNVNKNGSRDCGLFQISEYWQKTQCRFLLNPKVNIQIAYQLFTENGNQFNLWTCGKRLGI